MVVVDHEGRILISEAGFGKGDSTSPNESIQIVCNVVTHGSVMPHLNCYGAY